MNDEPEEKKMKMVEYQHRNEGGGNMVQLPNETFEHGEAVLVVSKRELRAMLGRAAMAVPRGSPYTELLEVLGQIERL
jgi:hypothetical protein